MAIRRHKRLQLTSIFSRKLIWRFRNISLVMLCFLFCYVLLCTSHTIGYKRSEHAPNRAPCTHAKRQNLFACNILATKNTFSVIINNLLVQMTWESLGGWGERETVTSRNPGHNDSHFLPRIHPLPTGDSFASRLFFYFALEPNYLYFVRLAFVCLWRALWRWWWWAGEAADGDLPF